jgi:general secretion pathway protein A
VFFDIFGFSQHPFAENPPTDQLWCDDRMEQALARLEFFSLTASLALITGPTGTGKSCLLRLYRQALPQNRFQTVYLNLTHLNPVALLRLMVGALGETPKMGKDRLLLQLLERVHRNELPTLLMIDDAHLLPAQALIDLRLLISSGLDSSPPLKLILCGQEILATQLKQGCHADLMHRIGVRVRLDTLSREQTAAYIDYRLRIAGGPERLFETEAKHLIHDFTGGNCRQINNIAVACLIQAHSTNADSVDADIVHTCMAEFRLA